MKQDLNLMVKKPNDLKAVKSALYILLLLCVLGGLYYLGTAIPDMMKNSLISQRTAMEQELAKLSDVQEKFSASVRTQNQLNANMQVINELESNKKDLPQIIDWVEKACPKEVTLTAYRFAADLVELNGTTDEDNYLADFVTELQKNKDFKTVMVNSTAYDEKTEKQSFTITAAFEQPLKAEPVSQSAAQADADNPAQPGDAAADGAANGGDGK